MEDSIYLRIKKLCEKHDITISKLESQLGLGNGTIRRWGTTANPSIDKIAKVAKYFNISTDYLLGLTEIESTMDEILDDELIITIQRAKEKMNEKNREKALNMFKTAFNFFSDDDEDSLV